MRNSPRWYIMLLYTQTRNYEIKEEGVFMLRRIASATLAVILLIASLAAAAEVVHDEKLYSQLEYGSKGNAVSELQKRLKELGFYSISVDGDYGKGTMNAVIAFEEYNGLEATGVATPELQAFLFSGEAKGVPIPDVEIAGLNLRQSYDYYFARPTFVNHTDSTIDGIQYLLKVYNASGERITYQVLTIEDVCRYERSDDYNLEQSMGEVNGMKIKPGEKYSVGSKNEIDFYSFDQNLLSVVYMAVSGYHTVDGETVEIPENEQVWYGSNGSVETVEYENNLKQVATLTNEIEDEADSFSLGIDFFYISNFFAEVVGIPMGGCYVNYVDEYDGIAYESSLKPGDIVVKIGDIWTFDEDSVLLAKGMMEVGEPTKVLYYRRGELRETEMTR